MREKIIIAGAGGQGIMLLGKVIAEAAAREDKYITWLPSYGAEVRGGTANCMVIISDREIGSPYVDRADTLLIMNSPSFKKFKPRLENKGLLIVDSSLIDEKIDDRNTHIIKGPFTYLAIKLGNIRVANMIALGCYVANKNIIKAESVLRAIEEIAPEDKKDLIEINKEALGEGIKIR